MRRLALLLAIPAMALAACGDDNGSSSASTAAGQTSSAGSETSAAGGGGSLQLTAADISFSPTELTGPAGQLTIAVQNNDEVEHNLTIEDLDVDQDVDAGEEQTVTIDDAQAGTYDFFCKYHPTKMKGTITVTG